MTREEIYAIKHLPEKYSIDGTRIIDFDSMMVAVNGSMPAIVFQPGSKRWKVLRPKYLPEISTITRPKKI